MSMLEVNDLKVSYGAIRAVKGVSFNVQEGEIVALIGANGAGKTTILRTISGLEKAESGSIRFLDQELTKMPAHRIVESGVIQVPERRRVFVDMTVNENLLLGANCKKDKSNIGQQLEKVYEIFPQLNERRQQKAGTLSGGEQQMLALGRALMADGKIILMDEPSMGLAPIVVEDIFNVIRKINAAGKSILLVEQNAFLALNTANRAYVLETGLITMQGDAKELLADENIKKAYLGGRGDENGK